MKLRDAFLVFSNLLFSFALKMGVTKACSYDPGNWAGPLSEISAHSYFPIKNSVAFIWVNGLAR